MLAWRQALYNASHLTKEMFVTAPEIQWIRDDASLAQQCREWRTQPYLALDTEFMRVDTFYPAAGLVQVGDGRQEWLIDPLLIQDLSPFAELLEDERVVKVLHACSEDLDIASDGRIYFSDASSKFHQPDYILDLLEARPHGRLLRYDPSTGKTEVLLKDLYFANGVALSANEDFVLVNETYRYRITRYWLKGEKAGQHEVFIDNLPGLPDNLQGDRKGTFWVALPTPRKADADFLHRHPWLKAQLAKLPRMFLPKPTAYGLVIAIDEQGRIVRSLHDTSGHHLRMITSAKPVGDQLYFGSLENDRIGRLAIP